MKNLVVVFLSLVFFSGVAVADKPQWAGKGKPTSEQKAAHKAAMQAKDDTYEIEQEKDSLNKEAKNKKEKRDKKIKEAKSKKGLEKQKEMKSTQKQNELDKGSEKGQEASSSKKKWWKFWE